MARSSARLRDREPAAAGPQRAVKDRSRPRALTRHDLELPDGRYLIVYGYAPASESDA